MIIGQPKSLSEVPDLTEEAMTDLFKAGEHLLSSGQPLDMPTIALTGIDFAIFLGTLKRLVEKNKELQAMVDEEEDAGVVERPEGFDLNSVLGGDNGRAE